MVNVTKRRNIDSAFTGKGFVKTTLGNGHFSYQLEIDGKIQNIRTKMSMGSSHRELGKPLLSKMARDLKMTPKEFSDYVICNYSYNEYANYLRDGNHI